MTTVLIVLGYGAAIVLVVLVVLALIGVVSGQRGFVDYADTHAEYAPKPVWIQFRTAVNNGYQTVFYNRRHGRDNRSRP